MKHLFIVVVLQSSNPTVPLNISTNQSLQSLSVQLWGYPDHFHGFPFLFSKLAALETVHFLCCISVVFRLLMPILDIYNNKCNIKHEI